ncbi:MAG TPA: LCP family protein, partial [Acidimicrobiia bacterium]|nr:LCP family protein [Acidimicrobiia bacterium]
MSSLLNPDRTRWYRRLGMRFGALVSSPRRRVLAVVGGTFLLLILAGAAYTFVIWNRIPRLDFDPEAARGQLESSQPSIDPTFFDSDEVLEDITTTSTTLNPMTITTVGTSTTTTVAALPPPPNSPGRGDLVGYILGGSDGSASIGNADAIYLAVSGRGTVLYTIPRSLYIPNPCTGDHIRAALLLRGCPGVASGPSLLALGLSEWTVISVGGIATVSYSGFPEIVDALGGITICSDTARGLGGEVIVPAGCNLLKGGPAAWWVTSRSQDELVDGEWRAVAGDDELSRSARQSIALQAVINRVLSFSSAGSLVSVANQVPGAFALGGMSVGEAA